MTTSTLATLLAALKPSEYRKYWRAWKDRSYLNKEFMRYIAKAADLHDLFAILQYAEIDGATFKPFAIKGIDFLTKNWSRFEEDFDDAKSELTSLLSRMIEEDKSDANVDLDTLYKDLFHGKFRLEFPIRAQGNFVELSENERRKFAYELEGFIALLFMFLNKPEEAEAIEENRWSYKFAQNSAPDYLNNGVYQFYSNPRRKMNLGKIFHQIKELGIYDDLSLKDQRDFDKLQKKFDGRNAVKGHKDLVLVLSRHPYDIAGMSTDRGWTSCTDLHSGSMTSYVMSSILYGALVAYLCHRSDITKISDADGRTMVPKNDAKRSRINIQRPLGRCLIKPMYREKDRTVNLINPNFILVCSRTYGTFPPSVVKQLQKWLDENWNREIDKEDSSYGLDEANFYIEDLDQPRRTAKEGVR